MQLALAIFPLGVYWLDPRIHTLGNRGVLGAFHANIAPAFTRLIDNVAYGGVDVRAYLKNELAEFGTSVDLACGTGLSTQFCETATGVDLSTEMLDVARTMNPKASFVYGQAESWGKTDSFDVATVFFALHEMPAKARARVVKNARRIARKMVVVVDICSSYEPTSVMLMGEPFILEFLVNIDDQMEMLGFSRFEIIPGHVSAWIADA